MDREHQFRFHYCFSSFHLSLSVMQNKKIVIAGGTGFIGQQLIRYFGKDNDLIILTRQIKDAANNRNKYNLLSKQDLSRTRFVKWDGENTGEWITELDGADLLINLSGKSVNCRYTAKNKKEILDSRTKPIIVLGEAISKVSTAPAVWINASSATIYREAYDHAQDEFNGEYGDDFSMSVCKNWEKAFNDQTTAHTRKIIFRLAITLGAGGLLIPYFNLLKFGLGGKQGSGKQMFTWIHIDDVCRAIEWAYEHENINGTYNCTSPHPVTNNEFMKALRKATGYRFGLPAFGWMVKIGTFLIGTEAELVLKSRWVIPTKLLQSGFKFQFPDIDAAFKKIIDKVPKKQYRLF